MLFDGTANVPQQAIAFGFSLHYSLISLVLSNFENTCELKPYIYSAAPCVYLYKLLDQAKSKSLSSVPLSYLDPQLTSEYQQPTIKSTATERTQPSTDQIQMKTVYATSSGNVILSSFHLFKSHLLSGVYFSLSDQKSRIDKTFSLENNDST